MTLENLSPDQLIDFHAQQQSAFKELLDAALKLDITRGKPSAAQLDLSNELLSLPGPDYVADGQDVRNYGGGQGLPQLREIFSELLKVPVAQLVAGDNASLAAMHDSIVFAMLHGTPDSRRPWSEEERVTFICPVPGYDRHFAITEHLGIEMVTVDMLDDGPDMDAVRLLVADPNVKGLWLVPTYSNPTGIVISEEVANELASMETAAPDFRLVWDNAYAVHHLTDQPATTPDILSLSEAAGHPKRPWIYGSTSKITFAGAGVSFFGSSAQNVEWYLSHTAIRSIGPDKVNQWRHAQLLKDADGVRELMAAHRVILEPKFSAVVDILNDRLGDDLGASWLAPTGGYFVNLKVVPGTATRIVELAKQAGIALTPAGAAFPYGNDPNDEYIRIAPSFPPLEELVAAIEGLATCVLLAAAEKALG